MIPLTRDIVEMTTARTMSFLMRRHKLKFYHRYFALWGTSEKHLTEVRSPFNLKGARFLSSEGSDLDVKLLMLDKCIRNYIGYLTHVCKNNQSAKTNIGGININTLSPLLQERIRIVADICELDELGKCDTEMTKIAQSERGMYETKLKEVDEELLRILLSNLNKKHCTNFFIEITAGAGGKEATLFVKDLCNMYLGHVNYLGADAAIVDIDENSEGGYKHVSILVSGKDTFEKFELEGGVHRVQRIPATEKSGRIHTSTAMVVILPEPTAIDVQINPNDVKVETKRASGAGGQHVNTTDSAVRLVHLPTGTEVTCQVERSQIKNKEIAFMKLRTKLYEQQLSGQLTSIEQTRKQQKGTGMRNEKVRTYNYLQDRITDHRIENGTVHHLKVFMQGGPALEELEHRLRMDAQRKMLLEIVKGVECPSEESLCAA